MQRKVVRFLIGKILQVEALLMMLPFIVSMIYRESWYQMMSYGSVILLLLVIGTAFSYKKPQHFKILARDGVITVALGWLLLSFFGALPLVISGEIPNIFDAFFEISSGFTTTGSSILADLSILEHSSLFWRSFTHLIGGMGVLVFTLAILPDSGSDSVQLMRAEVPGPVFGKLVSKLSKTARILYGIYLAMAAILAVVLLCLKVPLFDAILIACGTAGTGGFAVHNAGFALYDNQVLVEWVVAVGMMLFGINFNLYYLCLLGKAREVLKDEEFRYYLGIICVVTAIIMFSLVGNGDSFMTNLRYVFFTVSSLMTTTGFGVCDFGEWPVVAQTLLVMLMFCGGSAGSTAGGLKVSRVVIFFKSALAEFKRMAHPRRVIVPKMSGKALPKDTEVKVENYLLVYIVVFMLLLFSVSWEANDFTTAFTSVAATFNNIGPGLGDVGPVANYSWYSNWNKFVLSLGMIAGRLEIFPILLLFSPVTLKTFIKTSK